jgi:TIR domain
MFFLSYAEEDSETAREIGNWFRGQDIEVFDWKQQLGGRFMPQIEDAIKRADGYLALISPHFIQSDWCSREKEMALQRELALHEDRPQLVFVHVLEVLPTPTADAGLLGTYNWVSFTRRTSWPASFTELSRRLQGTLAQSVGRPAPGNSPDVIGLGMLGPKFRNRGEELHKVVQGLTVTGGPNFWLILAPPQLGKTWFLDRVREQLTQSEKPRWVARRLDVREIPSGMRGNALQLLTRLFERSLPISDEPIELRDIAREILRNGKPCLCLLDHAELLDKRTAEAFRQYLTQIYHHVHDANRVGVQVGLIVASRREDGWRGVTPDPRLIPLPLTEFEVSVVQHALHELAQEMGRDYGFNSPVIRTNAPLAYRLTEGLPALLVNCLGWIHAEEWFDMGRLESQELFDELTTSYIRTSLLAQESLLPEAPDQTPGSLNALEQAYRVLAPFRLFTRSHLRYYLEYDLDFKAALDHQGWEMEDLWGAISDTALLARPLDEPWKEIHSAIRRLLHRHYYKSAEQRADAHSEARKFMEVWADRQQGKEQAIGLVECLWHEAMALRIRDATEMARQLCDSARKLSGQIGDSSAYTPEELRRYAADRMHEDAELQETVSYVTDLFGRLVTIVLSPAQEP